MLCCGVLEKLQQLDCPLWASLEIWWQLTGIEILAMRTVLWVGKPNDFDFTATIQFYEWIKWVIYFSFTNLNLVNQAKLYTFDLLQEI